MEKHRKGAEWWRDTQVAEHFDINRTTVWAWVDDVPGFPQPVKFGKRVSRWRADEVRVFRPDLVA